MRKRTIAAWVAVVVAAVAVPAVGFFVAAWRIERLRAQDADPAFLPLVPLGATVYSNPVAFHRYCIYTVEFPPNCGLCDENAGELTCLNALPEEYELVVIIYPRQVTDGSLPHLKAIRNIDALDVSCTSISDAGIAQLRAAFPNALIVPRNAP